MVVHANSVIVENCMIGQYVTIGGKEGSPRPPVTGDNVYIAAGSKIIGDIEIGNNCIIRANSVVNKSFPDNSVIADVPVKKSKVIFLVVFEKLVKCFDKKLIGCEVIHIKQYHGFKI